jgi:hypothetical protein
MVARSFGGTPRRRLTSPSTRDAGGAPRSSARRFVTRRNPSALDSTLHSRETLFLSPIHEHVDTLIKHASRAQTLSQVGPARPREPTPTLSFRFQALSGFARACGTPRRAREGRRIERRIDRRSTFLRPNRESFTRDTREGTREHRLGGVVGASLLCDPSLC